MIQYLVVFVHFELKVFTLMPRPHAAGSWHSYRIERMQRTVLVPLVIIRVQYDAMIGGIIGFQHRPCHYAFRLATVSGGEL
jgi:hypothetical protein